MNRKSVVASVLMIVALCVPMLAQAHHIPKGKSELECLAENIYHEARGEGVHGMVAVGQVTLNRVKDRRWPGTVCGVVYQPKQFSWVGQVSGRHERKAWEQAKYIAKMLMTRKNLFSYFTATHYVHKRLHQRVGWTRTMAVADRIGQHVFYHA